MNKPVMETIAILNILQKVENSLGFISSYSLQFTRKFGKDS